MHDDDTNWKAQVQAALAAQQQVNACIQGLGTPPDWTPVRTAFSALFAALEELWQEVRAAPDRLQALPKPLQKNVLAVGCWRRLENTKPVELLVDLWRSWLTSTLVTSYFSKETELRVELINLYAETSNRAVELKNFAIASQLCYQGIDCSKIFLKDKKTNFEPQNGLLVLYYNAGNSIVKWRQDRAAADQFYRHGIFYGEKFLKYKETNSDVQGILLALYLNAANNIILYMDRESADYFYKKGIVNGEEFLEAGEAYFGVRHWLLRLYLDAGINKINNEEADQLYCKGIARGEEFLAAGETNPRVREVLLNLYISAGVRIIKWRHDRVEADRFYHKGIIRGQEFLMSGETDLGVQNKIIRLYGAITNNLIQRPFLIAHNKSLFWFLIILSHLLGWQWNCIDSLVKKELINLKGARIYRSTPIALGWWHEALYHFLLKFYNREEQHHKIDTLNILIAISKTLFLQSNAQDNSQFLKNFERWIFLKEKIENRLDDWKDRFEQHRQRLQDAVSQLLSEDQAELENLPSRLAELPWRQRLLHPLAYRRIQRDVQAYQKLLSQPVVNEELRSEIQNCQQLFAGWLAERWLDYHEILGELEEPGSALLGIVFAAHCNESPETVLSRWQTQFPWADPKDLSAAMNRTGLARVVLPCDDDAFTLHNWTERIDQPRLTIAEETLNFAGPALIPTLRAYHQGNVEPLQRTLEYAWTQTQEKAPTFARLLRRLSSAQGTAESFASSEPPPTEQEVRTALAALVLGDTRAVLAKALHDRLDQQWPLKEDTPLEEVQLCLKRRFSTLVSLSPGPRHHRELAERLHAWCQQALRRELASPHPDVTEIWNTLEHSRVALLGLKVKAPDPVWEEETARRIHAVLQHTPLVPPPDNPGQIWPPFQCWLDRLTEAGLLPELPTVADGQHRLRADEALVRLFFDPGSGHLFALWLEPDQPLALRRLDSATDWPHWRAFEDKTVPEIHDRWEQWQATAQYGQQDAAKPGVLDRWERWLEKEQPRPFPAAFHKVMTSPAVTTVVDTLQAWCRQTDRTRLIILLPAPLAQLPWEVLPPFDSGPITLERAISLSHWRVAPDPIQSDDSDNPEDPPDQPPLGVFFDSRPDSVILGRRQAQHAGTFWNRAVLGTDDGLTAFDILTHLHRHANGHLLLHGKYHQDDPRRSHLELRSDEHLYAWTASAVGVRGGLFGLAACQANLSGATTQTLLASVGLGPALIASGAAAVIGPLWSCNQWAALAFFHRLFELARQEPKELWSKLLQRARQDLQQMTKEDLLKLFKDNHLAEAEQQFEDFLNNYPELGDPPFGGNPFYWAPFILLGDDRRTDPHMIKPGV